MMMVEDLEVEVVREISRTTAPQAAAHRTIPVDIKRQPTTAAYAKVISSTASTNSRCGLEGDFGSGITVTNRVDRPSAHDEGGGEVASRSEAAAGDDEGDTTASAATQQASSSTITTTPWSRKVRPILLSDRPATPNSAGQLLLQNPPKNPGG